MVNKVAVVVAVEHKAHARIGDTHTGVGADAVIVAPEVAAAAANKGRHFARRQRDAPDLVVVCVGDK